jgi:hypothetical protein
MANANQGLKRAARIGWEQKLLKLCGADQFSVVRIPKEGIADKHVKDGAGNQRTWMPDHFKDVLESNGFECVDVVEGVKFYQKKGSKDEQRSGTTGRSFSKANSRPQRPGQGTQRPASGGGQASPPRTVSA